MKTVALILTANLAFSDIYTLAVAVDRRVLERWPLRSEVRFLLMSRGTIEAMPGLQSNRRADDSTVL